MRRIGAHLRGGWRRHADPAWLAGWEAESIALDGGLTDVVAMGDGPPLLLIPPLPGFKEAWLACARPFAHRFRVITFDLRVRFDGRPRWESLLDDLDRVSDAFGVRSAGVIGHSLGGALAQRWALSRPDRVRALVLSSSFARLTTPPGHWGSRYVEQPLVLAGQRLLPRRPALALARWLAAREAWVYDRRCDDRVLGFVWSCIRGTSVREAGNAVRLAWDHDTREALLRLGRPTLVVVGERESVFAREAATELERLIPGATLRVSPGTGHLHLFSRPEWLVETVGAWLGPRLET